jgi:pimeloyl-ACP methyl ester carboxylesterase
MSSFVLIHGSWHGAWCWRKLIPLLRDAGHEAVAPDLPAHGSDPADPSEVTLSDYVDRILGVVAGCREPVVLVGHSMGGAAITQAAQGCAESLASLVYLTAFMPEDGDSVIDQAACDTASLINDAVVLDPVAGTISFAEEAVRDCFYGDCSPEDESYARERLCQEPVAPLTTPLDLAGAAHRSLPRVYIECTKDRAVTPEMQRLIHRDGGFSRVHSLDTGHSPFFSAPQALAKQLLEAGSL